MFDIICDVKSADNHYDFISCKFYTTTMMNSRILTRTVEKIDIVNILFIFQPVAGFYPNTIPVQK